MQPAAFLYFLVSLTLLAAILHRVLSEKRAGVLREMARAAGMIFVAEDRFRLAERLEGRLPLPGASGLRVMDLMYTSDADRRRYLFTCEFGRGVVLAQCRLHRVAAFEEPLTPSGEEEIDLRLAPENLGVLEQYRSLLSSSANTKLAGAALFRGDE